MSKALLIAQLDPAEVEHAILHRRQHLLAAASRIALVQGGDDAKCQVQAGAAIADLGAGDQRRPIIKASGGCRAAGTLRDVFVNLVILVGTRTEALDRSQDDAGIELLNPRPGQPHALKHAGREILHHHVANLDEFFKNLTAFAVFGIQRERTLVAVQHGKIQAIGIWDITQLAARDVAFAGALNLDHVGAEPG